MHVIIRIWLCARHPMHVILCTSSYARAVSWI